VKITDVVPDDADDAVGMDLPVTHERVRALVTKIVKDHTRSAVIKDYAVSAGALMTVARFQREEEDLEDTEEVPADE
jgi:hypothetical protein